MTNDNQQWTKNTTVNNTDLMCDCGKEVDIYHCSNWHNGTGIFYATCQCGREVNISWKQKDNTLPETRPSSALNFILCK